MKMLTQMARNPYYASSLVFVVLAFSLVTPVAFFVTPALSFFVTPTKAGVQN
jgi:hypothetical protein